MSQEPISGLPLPVREPVGDRLDRIEQKLDELLEDSRAARPLLERYLKLGRAPWAGAAGKAGRRG